MPASLLEEVGFASAWKSFVQKIKHKASATPKPDHFSLWATESLLSVSLLVKVLLSRKPATN